MDLATLNILHAPYAYIPMKTIAFQCLFDAVESPNFFSLKILGAQPYPEMITY